MTAVSAFQSPVSLDTGPNSAAATAPISRLGAGDSGLVVEVTAENQDSLRLKALGICQGRRVQILRAGDPLIVRVVGARVGLSSRLAEKVVVEIG